MPNVANLNYSSSLGQVPSSNSTITLQSLVDDAQTLGDLEPVLTVAGSAIRLALRAANDVNNAIYATTFPWKWNELWLPFFYTNSWQQDYALVNPDGSSVTNLSWLERGIAIDINNTSIPKPWVGCECGRQLPQRTGTYLNSTTGVGQFVCNWFPNFMLYYGVWGEGTLGAGSLGNNPTVGSVYTNPIGCQVLSAVWQSTDGGQTTFGLNYLPNGLEVGGVLYVTQALPNTFNGTFSIVGISGTAVTVTQTSNPGTYSAGGIVVVATAQTGESMTTPPNFSQPSNPITQIIDQNGNYLLLTTYGTEGTTAPVAPKNAAPGTTCSGEGATTVWTVLDPQGAGIRILEVPPQSGVVWQFNLVGQMKPIRFTNLKQTLYPLPDEMEPHFFQGFITQLYKYSPEAKTRAKFDKEWPLWIDSLHRLQGKNDRELEENLFVPQSTIMGSGVAAVGWQGASWPYNYPRPTR